MCAFNNLLNISLSFSASALEPGIDLLEALNLHNNHSQYLGVTMAQGSSMKLAYRLSKFLICLPYLSSSCFFYSSIKSYTYQRTE